MFGEIVHETGGKNNYDKGIELNQYIIEKIGLTRDRISILGS
jgi:hypothetical protein